MPTDMFLTIPKSPYANLDQLHALGLAILIANATQSSVQLSDRGGFYQLEGVRPAKHEIEDFGSVLDRVLRLPTLADDGNLLGDSVALHNLAGTLTVSLSYPGKRIVGSALNHRNAAEMLNQPAVDKAQKVVNRIKLLAIRRVQRRLKGPCWLSELLAEYKRHDWAAFQVTNDRSSSLSIPVTIEPSLGFGTRSLVNLNQNQPTNMTIVGPAFVDVLAYIGAIRYCRSQKAAADDVNIYIPFFSRLTVDPDGAMPGCFSADVPASTAAVAQWVNVHLSHGLDGKLAGLGFITFQLKRQSLLVQESGYYDNSWLTQMEALAPSPRWTAPGFWRSAFWDAAMGKRIDLSHLIDALHQPHGPAWWKHLVDYGFCLASVPTVPTGKFRAYNMEEILLMASMTTVKTPLSTLLDEEDKTGVKNIGRALRSILENKSRYGDPYPEIVAKLQCVRTELQLMNAIADLAMHCRLAKETNEYVIVPNDDDFYWLLKAVDVHGPANIAALIVVLSTLYYPRSDNEFNKELVNDVKQ